MSTSTIRPLALAAVFTAFGAGFSTTAMAQLPGSDPRIDPQPSCTALREVGSLQSSLNTALLGDGASLMLLGRHQARLRMVADTTASDEFKPLQPSLQSIDMAVETLAQHFNTNVSVRRHQQKLARQAPELAAQANAAAQHEAPDTPGRRRLAAVRELENVYAQIGTSAGSLLAAESTMPLPDAVFKIGKGLNSLQEINTALIDGSPTLQLPATKDAAQNSRLQSLARDYAAFRAEGGVSLNNLQAFAAMREARGSLERSTADMSRQLNTACAKTL